MDNNNYSTDVTRDDESAQAQNNQTFDKTTKRAMLLGGLGVLAGATAEAAIVKMNSENDPSKTPVQTDPQKEVISTPEQVTKAHHQPQQHQVITHVHKHEIDVHHEYTIHVDNNNNNNGGEAKTEITTYETVRNDDGEPIYDMAGIKVTYPDGKVAEGAIVDTDRDGKADVLVLDENFDGNITENEVTDLNEAGIDVDMETLREQAQVVKMDDYENDVVTSPAPDNDVAMADESAIEDYENGEKGIEQDAQEEPDDDITMIDENGEQEDYIADNDPCASTSTTDDYGTADYSDTGILDV